MQGLSLCNQIKRLMDQKVSSHKSIIAIERENSFAVDAADGGRHGGEAGHGRHRHAHVAAHGRVPTRGSVMICPISVEKNISHYCKFSVANTRI